MMYINYTVNVEDVVQERTLDWHVGETAPKDVIDDESVQVLDIYADGEELEYIRDYFVGIPMKRRAHGVLWRGEFARFIFDNMTA